MNYSRFLELILTEKAGELSADARAELNQFLRDHPDTYYKFWRVREQFFDLPVGEINKVDQEYLQKRWDSLKKKTTQAGAGKEKRLFRRRQYRLRFFYIVAASVALFVLFTFFLLNQRYFHSNDLTVATKLGSKTSMKLPDGSKVWLNAGSKISYNEDFGRTSRHVQLSGEAYFDVAHDAELPFVVQTPNFSIKVLGTAFNVKAYEGDKESEATLVRGLIEVDLNNKDEPKIILKPNEKLIFKTLQNARGKDAAEAFVHGEVKIARLAVNDSLAVETQWVRNCLAFRNSKLKDIAVLISRWYGVSVEILDASLGEKEFNGRFKDESVDQVMQALKLAGGFNYIIDQNKITIVP